MKPVSLSYFFDKYYPILGSFITGVIITQTNLMMITPLGERASAAFIVPIKIMFLDPIVAFALAPYFCNYARREFKPR